MSVEIILYPQLASKTQLRKLLVQHGFEKCQHLWDWPKGSLHFQWFDEEDFKSTTGVEATICPPTEEEQRVHGPCKWALHTRTRAFASSFDRDQQNCVIRSARKEFGGHFINDWHGKNRYTPVGPDTKGPVGRGIYQTYEFVTHQLSAVRCSLPRPSEPFITIKTKGRVGKQLSQLDPCRVLYNAIAPFAVAALEHFFSQSFKILLRYERSAQARLAQENRRVEMQDLIAISEGRKTVEDIVAGWYSFQRLESIHSAFNEWFKINIWKLLRTPTTGRKRITTFDERLNQIIQFRHSIIHRFEFDTDFDFNEIEEVLDCIVLVIEAFVDYLEQDRKLTIRDRK
jgi:hypothetical protein